MASAALCELASSRIAQQTMAVKTDTITTVVLHMRHVLIAPPLYPPGLQPPSFAWCSPGPFGGPPQSVVAMAAAPSHDMAARGGLHDIVHELEAKLDTLELVLFFFEF